MDLSNVTWRKSKRSHAEGDACVELAAVPGAVAVRDSKNPEGGVVLIGCEAASVLSRAVKSL
ncbi:hypothetical protein GCM10009678_02340 [Actinomadura kijaniata]|uniref:DUF397 domain-containing protein n=1 Tax=Actinomadura kijaniata TaxID=46161 RepID=UPI001602BEB2|nr:DUF397 domain-containing protein [Actinomadura namibiensis]